MPWSSSSGARGRPGGFAFSAYFNGINRCRLSVAVVATAVAAVVDTVVVATAVATVVTK